MSRIPVAAGPIIGVAGVMCGLGGASGTSALSIVAGSFALVNGVLLWKQGSGKAVAVADAVPRSDPRSAATASSNSAADTFDELGGDELEPLGSAVRNDPEALMDPETGLYTENYLMVALDARIAAARRRLRPVAFALIDVVADLDSGTPALADAVAVSASIRATVRAADTAARLTDGRYAVVLEDTPENGAIWTIERLRTALVSEHDNYTVRAGIACYPSHAFNVEEILDQANAALVQAREWRQDRIEVATAD